jgi:hypothetical protein
MFALKTGASRCGRRHDKHQKSPANGTKHPKSGKLSHYSSQFEYWLARPADTAKLRDEARAITGR